MSRSTAVALGVSLGRQRHEVARGRWSRPAPGLIATFPAPLSRTDWIAAGLCSAGPSGLVTGWDGAALAGVPIRVPPSAKIVMLTHDGRSRTVGPVAIRRSHRPAGRHLSSIDHRDLPLVPYAGLGRCIADAALESAWTGPIVDLVTAALRAGKVSIAQLTVELDEGPRNRSATLRRVLADVGASHSVAEHAAANALRQRGISGFEQNAPATDAQGHVVAKVDFLWRQLRACLEIDSWQHHGTHEQWLATMDRHTRLTAAGFAAVHIAPRQVARDPEGWADSVANWLIGRALELNLDPSLFVRPSQS